jgi:Lipocalin-like domain
MQDLHRMLRVMSMLMITLVAFSCRSPEQAPSTTAAQNRTANGLEGVWRETEIVVTGRDASTIQNPQPSIYVFTPTHYAMMGTLGDRPRALFKSLDPTNEEKIAGFDSFWGNSGTYEVTGDVLTIRPVVARMPNFMAGGFQRYQFHVDGNTLLLTSKSTDENYRVGEQVMPDARPTSETRTRLMRVQ